MSSLDDELANWDVDAYDWLLPEQVPDIWAVLGSRHPGLVAAFLRVEGRDKDVLVMGPDLADGGCAQWLAHLRVRLDGAQPLDPISGGNDLPGVWYVFGDADLDT